MTVAATITSVQYLSNGTTTQFSFPNKIFAASDLIVTIVDTFGNRYSFANQTNVTLGLSYTVQNVDVDTGCLITFNVSPTTGWTLDLRTQTPEIQSTSIKNQGQFLPELHEEAFDKLTREVQDLTRLTYTYGIHGPDTEVTAWPALPGPTGRANQIVAFDANGLPYAATPISPPLTQAIFNQFLSQAPPQVIPTTAAEIAAGATVVNPLYPPLLVDRYGTNTTPGTTDMTTAWQAAIAVGTVAGGTVTCLQSVYKISGTLVIAGPVSIDGGNAFVNYPASGAPGGAMIYAPALNAPILQYNQGSRFVRLDNINLAGIFETPGNPNPNTSQDGIVIGTNAPGTAHGIRIRNVSITDVGRFGINVQNSIGGDYQSIYIVSHNNASPNVGIYINAQGASNAVGANRWYNINTSGCPSGVDVNNTGGGVDSWYGVTAENGANGIVFESGVTNQIFRGVHTEGNTTTGIRFKAGTNYNIVEAEVTGSSVEPLPINAGGSQNFWMGSGFAASVFLRPVLGRCVQRVSTAASAQVTGSGLSAMSAGIVPTTGEGLQILSQSITSMNSSTKHVVRANGFSQIGTTGAMIIAVFQGSTCIYSTLMAATGGANQSWCIETEVTGGTQNQSLTYTVRVGSTTGPDTVSAFGAFVSGGPVNQGQIVVEEFLPSA